MRKKGMKKSQLAERNMIVETLTAAGWEGTPTNKMFDDGDFVVSEAAMDYSGTGMQLGVEYQAKGRCIYLRLAAGGKKILLRIDYGENLQSVMHAIVNMQDKVTARNFRTHVRSLVGICPDVFALIGGDEGDWVRVLDKKGKVAL